MADEEKIELENQVNDEAPEAAAEQTTAETGDDFENFTVSLTDDDFTEPEKTAEPVAEAEGDQTTTAATQAPVTDGERKIAVPDSTAFNFENVTPAWQPRRNKKNPLFIIIPAVALVAILVGLGFLYMNIRDGWHINDTTISYRENFKKVTGLYTIDGVQYLFDSEGYLLEGAAEYEGNIYYSTKDGIAKGDVSVDGTNYHFHDQTGILYRGFYTFDGAKYYSDNFGFPVPGLIIEDGKYYYCDENGKLSSGWVTTEEGKRYFGTEDLSAAIGVTKIESDTYIFAENGTLLYGLQQTDSYLYYADPDAGVCKYGIISLDDVVYCFDENGKILNGKHTVAGQPWYFENNVAVTGWVENKTMYSTTEGLVTGSYSIDGKMYLFDENYILVTGWRKENGVTKYYDYDGIMLTGWQEIIGETYYFDKYGALATGLTVIDNVQYCFNDDGTPFNGWTEVEGAQYWFNDKGVKTTGWAVVDGKLRYLSIHGGYIGTGWQSYRQKKFYIYEDGVAALGLTEIDGKKYYFGEDGYWITESAVVIDGKRYYFKSDGTMGINTTVDGWICDENGVATATFALIMEDNLDDYLASVVKEVGTDITALYKWIKKKVPTYSLYSTDTVNTLREKGEYDKLYRTLAIEALNKGKGACWHYAALTKLLLEKAGYTAEVVKGGGHSANEHNWVVVWVDNQWKHIDSMRINSNVCLISDEGLKTYKFEYKNTQTNRHGPHPEYNYTYTDCYYYGYTLPANP